MTRTALVLGLGLAIPGIANACGGFFCNPYEPIDQAGEDILFAVDSEAGTVTMHVQIEYEGPAEEFAWVVPVPEAPDIDLSTEVLFDALDSRRAMHALQAEVEGNCAVETYTTSASYWGSSTGSTGTSSWTSTSTTSGPGVTIVSSGKVGPYETVVLAATDSVALTDWLQDNGYDLPAGIEPLLAPYVSNSSNFVALKLAKNADTGDLAPLAMTYPGDTATIPIQLTSIAATPDMRLRVYILGDERSVPENYLHVQVNPAAIDWWSWVDNWEDVVTQAADEAGGHAFATDFSGDPAPLAPLVYSDSWDSLGLESATDAYDFMLKVVSSGLPADDTLLSVLEVHYPDTGTGITARDMANCPSCYMTELQNLPFDVAAAADDMETFILEPRRTVAGMLETFPVLTRMTSSVSPEEMTLDPVFVFNPDMPEVDYMRDATETILCNPNITMSEAVRELTLEDGQRVLLPPETDMGPYGGSYHAYLRDVVGITVPAAAVIEITGASGLPVPVVDNRPGLLGLGNAHNMGFPWNEETGDLYDTNGDGIVDGREAGGCGCATSGPAQGGALGLMLLALGLRRRD